MSTLQIVVLVLAVVVLLGWLILTFVVKGKQRTGEAEAVDLVGGSPEVSDPKAICKGTESGAFNEWVGMGTLALGADELVFVRWSPHDVMRIELSDLSSHVFTSEHLGRDSKTPLLQVRFANAEHTEGETPGQDIVAWQVSDQDAWNDALE